MYVWRNVFMRSFTFQRTLKTEGNIEESSVLPRARYLLLEAMKREQAGGILTADARRAEAQRQKFKKEEQKFWLLKTPSRNKVAKNYGFWEETAKLCRHLYTYTYAHTCICIYTYTNI